MAWDVRIEQPDVWDGSSPHWCYVGMFAKYYETDNVFTTQIIPNSDFI